MCSAQAHVRFTPIATAKADFRKWSCLLYPQADMCAALVDVCKGPKADTKGDHHKSPGRLIAEAPITTFISCRRGLWIGDLVRAINHFSVDYRQHRMKFSDRFVRNPHRVEIVVA